MPSKEYQAEWRKRRPDLVRRSSTKFNLKRVCKEAGITLEQYYETVERQKGLCAICHQPQRSGRWSRLVVDHDHVTGEFRGLLCMACNTGLGHFSDNLAIMESAVAYLRASKPLFQVIDGTND